MGVLGVSGRTGEDHIDPPEPEGEGAAPEEQARDDAGQFVPAERLQPETVESRRARKQRENFEGYVKPMKEEWDNERKTYQQKLDERDQRDREQAQELARLRGAMEMLQRQPQQQQAAQPALPDPDRLQAEADAALEKNDLRTYHAKTREVARAEAAIIMANERKQFQQEMERRIPPQVPQHIQGLIMQHPAIAAAGDKGMRAVIRADQELEDEGVPAGYERQKQAFARAAEKFGVKKPPARPAYSTDSREALAAIPTGRPSATAQGDAPGVRLTAAQEAARRAGGFKDAEEYLKWNDPHKYGLVK